MFTGIIQDIGTIKKLSRNSAGEVTITVAHHLKKPAKGASIAVNGACLTVTKAGASICSFDVIPETLTRTNLGQLKVGSQVNLEPSLTLSAGIDGHLVSGHIDCVTKIVAIKKGENGTVFTLALPKNIALFVAEKGSITINGVSLTITAVTTTTFSVALIPFTLSHTTLGEAQVGDAINLEVDLIARYVEGILMTRKK